MLVLQSWICGYFFWTSFASSSIMPEVSRMTLGFSQTVTLL